MEKAAIIRKAIEDELYNTNRGSFDRGCKDLIEVARTLPTRVMRDNIHAALTVGLIQAQLNQARNYEFPENFWEVLTDVGGSGEGELHLSTARARERPVQNWRGRRATVVAKYY